MQKKYISKYGKMIKNCPGLTEYWYHGKLVARGSSLSSPDPNVPPTREDWEFCVSLRPEVEVKAKISKKQEP